ncbi:MAG: polyhydroxyalkanoate depolymerase, partial [Roseinatronobacter sp.]
MKGMATYDLMESIRNTNEWMGASARAFASYPIWGMAPNPIFKVMSARGRVTERSFARMVIKPDWGITSVVAEDGRDHIVEEKVEIA